MTDRGRGRGRPSRMPLAIALVSIAAILVACTGSPVGSGDGVDDSIAPSEGPVASLIAPAPPSVASPVAVDVCNVPVGQSTTLDVPVGTATRKVTIHRPASAPKDAIVVLALHGYGQGAVDMESTSGLSKTADEKGFIVVYPEGAGSPPAWGIDPASPAYAQDTALFAGLAEAFADGGCADPGWTVAVGFSWGAFMADAMACTGADWLVAVAPVAAGGLTGKPCDPPVPMPIVAFNGDGDETIPYNGGPVLFPDGSTPAVDASTEWAAAWAKRNGCVDDPATDPVGSDLERLSWTDCQAAVTHYTVKGGKHAWPAEANDLIWAFIEALPRLR